MKLRLMDIIVCPKCKKTFKLYASNKEILHYSDEWRERVFQLLKMRAKFREVGDADMIWGSMMTDIIEGELVCKTCEVAYPIQNGVPRILTQELLTLSGCMGRGNPKSDTRISSSMDQIGSITERNNTDLFIQVQMANQSNYGYEWKAFSHEYKGWEHVYKNYYITEDDDFFESKIGLDAGCGMGRYTMVSASKGAEMVGLDLSNAIEVSYAKSRNIPTFHAIQADIYNLPFRDNYFDFAQSLGVIHITPDPERALLSIKKTIRPEGKFFIYVYPNFKDENSLKYFLLKIIKQVRKLTVKLPSNILYWLLYPILPLILFFFYFPTCLLWHIPRLRKLSTIFPYNYEQFRGRRFRDFHMNLFDRFGNPVERRYSREEMEQWMNKANFKEYSLRFKDGWMVSAMK
jgi:uncharacterized protein YbaR (Trm112 family)/SAM-dependent methyltransferase